MANSIKITARLMIGFGTLMLIVACLSGFSAHSGSDAAKALANVVRLKSGEVLSQRVEKSILEARLAIWMGAATGDQAASARAEAALKIANERLDELVAATTDPKHLSEVKTLQSRFAEFQPKLLKIGAIGGSNPAFYSPEHMAAMKDAMAGAAKITEISEPLLDQLTSAADGLASKTSASLNRVAMVAIIVGIVSVLLGCGVSFVVSRSITRPIRALTTAMQSLAKGDASTRIPATGRKDEIGEMAKTVEVFKVNMIEADRLRAEQEVLKQHTADERRKTMLELAAKFEASAGSIVTDVTAQAMELQTTAQSMASIAEETSHQASTVAAASEQATQNVNTVAASTEELSSSVREILQRVTESTNLASETAKEANDANTGMHALSSTIDRIGQVAGLINGIAGQTNLLALNATIEAARAGDAGKGFAVVASEVKALANQTAKATEEISGQIAAIQAATKDSVNAIQGIVTRINKVSETATAIASAVEEQGAATAEIARNVVEAAKGTGEVTSNIVGVNTAAQQTGAAASQMLTSASSLSQNSETLKRQVEAFLLEVRAA